MNETAFYANASRGGFDSARVVLVHKSIHNTCILVQPTQMLQIHEVKLVRVQSTNNMSERSCNH